MCVRSEPSVGWQIAMYDWDLDGKNRVVGDGSCDTLESTTIAQVFMFTREQQMILGLRLVLVTLHGWLAISLLSKTIRIRDTGI